MPVSVVVGGQFGSEGKGKVAHAFAKMRRATVAVRVGGPNSGHTALDSAGDAQILRQLPTGALLPDTLCIIPPGSYIDVDIFLSEVGRLGLSPTRVLVDPNAVVIGPEDKGEERKAGLGARIGSTESGTGAAVVKRVQRISSNCLARNDVRLAPYIRPTRSVLRTGLKRNENIVIEGTQGFGLSLLHSADYPNTTSRDTSASAFVAEAGLSPLDVEEVVLVIRAYPIRVSGNSGPLPNEVDWTAVTDQARSSIKIVEHTSATKKIRRVARFDAQVVLSAIEVNRPNIIVLNHLDYIDSACRDAPFITEDALRFVEKTEAQIGQPIDYLGVGPGALLLRRGVAVNNPGMANA